MKKALCYLIIISMLVHCASRLGFISYIYKQRHEIAFSLGLTAERVIAICKDDYHQQFKLVEHQADNETIPVPLANQIDLFTVVDITDATFNNSFKINTGTSFYSSAQYDSYPSGIFRPPLV